MTNLLNDPFTFMFVHPGVFGPLRIDPASPGSVNTVAFTGDFDGVRAHVQTSDDGGRNWASHRPVTSAGKLHLPDAANRVRVAVGWVSEPRPGVNVAMTLANVGARFDA